MRLNHQLCCTMLPRRSARLHKTCTTLCSIHCIFLSAVSIIARHYGLDYPVWSHYSSACFAYECIKTTTLAAGLCSFLWKPLNSAKKFDFQDCLDLWCMLLHCVEHRPNTLETSTGWATYFWLSPLLTWMGIKLFNRAALQDFLPTLCRSKNKLPAFSQLLLSLCKLMQL